MKFSNYIIGVTLIYQCFCSAAEVLIDEPIAPLEQSRIYQAPQIADIVFPHKQAKIVIYTDDPAYGNKLNGYLHGDAAILNQISLALNVMLVGQISVINNYGQFLSELDAPNQPERIIIAFGDNATEKVLTYLYHLNTQGIINSVILFDPIIPGATAMVYKAQYIPQYNFISNRIYNFYSKYWPTRVWRKIHPAQTGVPPAQLDDQYYFKGLNICTLFIDQNGAISEKFNFATIDKDGFHKIIDAIQKTNQYHLQPDLKVVIKNYSSEVVRSQALYPLRKINADLPLLSINKPLVLTENQPELQSEVVDIGKVALAAGYTSEYYTCRIQRALAERLRPIIKNEKELADHAIKIQGWGESKIEHILRQYSLVKDNPYTPEKIRDAAIDQVSTAIETYRLEHDYIEARKPVVRHALQELCHGPANYINIAIVASGGGSRAMFATYGVLKGLQSLGVLAATSYICGLSGSTWAISTLFKQANSGTGMTVPQALASASKLSAEQANGFNFFKAAFVDAPKHYFEEYTAVLKVKSLFNQPITNTDYYGNSIATTLLGADERGVKVENYTPHYLSQQLGEQARWLGSNFRLPVNYVPKLPFPIYTAVMPLYNTRAKYYPWFEFTPYQIGAVLGINKNKIGMFVKTWAFGRAFEGGISKDFAPEQALEFYLGVFGSAMNSTLREMANMVAPAWLEKPGQIAKYVVSWIPVIGYFNVDYRWRFAEVLNPMYGDSRFGLYSTNQNLPLIDAGLAFNLPFPPLNDHKKRRPDRKPDVVIFIDASADAKDLDAVNDFGGKTKQAWPNGDALYAVEEYAGDADVTFPKLPGGNLATETCSIFDQANCPLVIYLPVTKDTTEISVEATFNGVNLINKVKHENTIDGQYGKIIPIDLDRINLNNYKTKTTNLSEQAAVDLMAIMQYNVLNNGEKIKQAICRRVPRAVR